ncbi:MAG: hypothetical protein O6920_06930 [Chloroflexi bacterium]|nr:hypothetical protein [Chloroflexota bacterium]
METALLAQRGLTVAISAYNAIFFIRYRLRTGRRRLGAVVLAFISLAIAGESIASGLLPWLLEGTSVTAAGRHVAASLSLAVSMTIAALILRQKMRKR